MKKYLLLRRAMILFLATFAVASLTRGATIYVDDDNTTGPWDGTVEHPHQYIQDAVNNANSGDTVYVFVGTYFENVIVDRRINLVSEDSDSTIIDAGGDGSCIHITADYVNVSGFIIRNGGRVYPNAGIYVDHSNHTVISGSIITNNGSRGILLSGSLTNDISGKVVTENNDLGMCLEGSSDNNTVSQNTISYNSWGIDVDRSNDNVIAENAIIHNYEYGLMLYYSNNNSIYHNDIINKAWNAIDKWYSANNWDDGYPSGGNYWGDYTGSDNFSGPEQNIPGSDGIGDTPYDNIPGGSNQDNYPLMTTVLGLYADPRGPYTGNVGEIIQFTGSAHGCVPPYNWHWNFGDGNTSNQQNPTHSYDTPGFYAVGLTVSDSDDSIASGYSKVRVLHPSQSYVWVDDDFNESTPGWAHDHFDNIQDGVDISGHGGTVYVYNGIYHENIVVDKTINLVGENKEAAIIDAGRHGSCIQLTADSVSISGFTVRNSGGTEMEVAGIYISSSYNVITDNIVTENPYNGIHLLDLYSNPVDNNRISGNILTNNGAPPGAAICVNAYMISHNTIISDNVITGNYAGVKVARDYNSVISGNTMQGNRFGIYFGEGGGYEATISGNALSNNTEYGIYVDPWSVLFDSRIFQNTIVGNGNGIKISGGRNAIHDNIIDNERMGVYVSHSYDDTVTNNTIVNHAYGSGVFVAGSHHIVVSENHIAYNSYGAFMSANSHHNTISGNSISGNIDYGLYIEYFYELSSDYNMIHHNDFNNTSNAFDECTNTWYDSASGEGNYWNDYTGVDDDHDGIGDTPYDIPGGANQDLYPLMSPCAYDRGDANGDGQINVSDALYMLNYLFRHGPPPVSFEAGDANCDNDHGAMDVIFLLNYLFRGGPAPGCS